MVDPLGPVQVDIPDGPIAVVTPAAQALNMTAGGSLTLNASGSACPSTPASCAVAWAVTCPEGRANATADGPVYSVTAGTSPSDTINVTRSSGVTCEVTVTVTDGNGIAESSSWNITVRSDREAAWADHQVTKAGARM